MDRLYLIGGAPSQEREWGNEPEGDATEVAFSNRLAVEDASFMGNQVEAALEPVAVMPHHEVTDPTDPTITLLFGGEVALGDLKFGSPDEADQLLSQLSAYQQADVSMVNLGNSLATAGTTLQENYHHRTRPDAVAALKEGGVDIVGLTSDRTMDHGAQGLVETIETLDREGIYRVGAGRNQREARRPEILDVKGQRIAYLGYTPASTRAAKPEKAGTNVPTQDMILEDITAIRPEVDWVVVNYRWLGDLALEPAPQQMELSRMAVDAGADLVVGYHPTQLQGAEVYKGRPIIYALGDFIFEDTAEDDARKRQETAALKVSLGADKMKVEFLPVIVQGSRPQSAMGEAGEAILQKIRQASKTLPAPIHFPVELDAQPKPRMTPKVSPTHDLEQLTDSDSAWGEIEPVVDILQPTGPSEWSNEPTVNPFETYEPAVNPFETPFETYEADWGEGAEENFDYWPDAPVETPEAEVKQDSSFDPSQENPFAPMNSDTQNSVEQRGDQGFIDHPPLEGPDSEALEGWGPKSSPHREFSPIPDEHLPLETSPAIPQSGFSADPVSTDFGPAGFTDAAPINFDQSNYPDTTAPDSSRVSPPDVSPEVDAIQPYSEPLVGPLTQNELTQDEGLSAESDAITIESVAMIQAQSRSKPGVEKPLPQPSEVVEGQPDGLSDPASEE